MRHSSFLEVDLSLLGQNFQQIKALAPKAEILPMVKSDAYGNGMIPVSQFLVNECGVRKLGCATLGEALRLFDECPNLNAEALVFSDSELLNEKAREAYFHYNITPILHRKCDLELVLKDPAFKKMPLVLKMNTAMNRLGLLSEDLDEYMPLLKQRGVEHLLTHFARSAQTIRPGDKCHKQYQEFELIKQKLQQNGVEIRSTSIANSGAIEQQFGVGETFVRPGLMLYGPPSVLDPVIWHGKQVSRLVTKVISTAHVKKGTPVGYGVNVADKDSFMIAVALGYGDGMLTFLSGTKLQMKGHVGKIFGRVNMDVTLIQFDPEAESSFKPEDQVEIWNHDSRVITDIAIQSKTHAYQLMCSISPRIPRIYKVK